MELDHGVLFFLVEMAGTAAFAISGAMLAIQRGLRMVYRHRRITRALYEKYRRRYSPWGSVASLYLWAAAGGALPELTDPAPAGKKPGKKR